MAALSSTKYQDDSGSIHPIYMSLAKITASSVAPTGDINAKGRAIIGGSRKKAGLHARGVRIKRTLGTAPLQFQRYAFIPVLTAAALATPAYQEGSDIDYNGQTWTVTESVGEKSA